MNIERQTNPTNGRPLWASVCPICGDVLGQPRLDRAREYVAAIRATFPHIHSDAIERLTDAAAELHAEVLTTRRELAGANLEPARRALKLGRARRNELLKHLYTLDGTHAIRAALRSGRATYEHRHGIGRAEAERRRSQHRRYREGR